MKLKFKNQAYQTSAVSSVVDCFEGQPKTTENSYQIDPSVVKSGSQEFRTLTLFDGSSYKNEEIFLSRQQVLENIKKVQIRQHLPLSASLIKSKASGLNLDVEMETGTGKTYCYIKTIFELNKHYGWTKFIIVVPSIAIREGVNNTLEITAGHFQELYSKKAKFFIYNSKQLYNLNSFSSDAGINVMVINVQAFNSHSKDNRRIYEERDDFQSRRPIDVIKASQPILILDEPQKMEGAKTLDSLKEFNPLFILRYSATHKTQHNKVHRLDALDAYNQKLVKKIAVRGISVKGLAGKNPYLYLESIEVSKRSPVARIEFELKQKNGIKRVTRKLIKGDNLFYLSGELDQYKGFLIADVNASTDSVQFTNGHKIQTGEASGDVNETTLRRIQIREAIKAHFEKEQALYHQGIKVLTLYFIDEVAKYRVYGDAGEESGEYAKIFEEEYQDAMNELSQDKSFSDGYIKYLDSIPVERTHTGYFSIDKKSQRMVDPLTGRKSTEADDVDAYDLILKDKERLLSFDEPTRFIFSHSALREGWDNPNIFVICTLKHSDNTISRRQEVGRGLRIAVNQFGDRQDNPVSVHQTNVLTVVASESYKDFVKALQQDISKSLSERPRVADVKYFSGKILQTNDGSVLVTKDMAEGIEYYLIQNGYVDRKRNMVQKYHDTLNNDELAELPNDLQPYKKQVFQLIDSVYSDALLPEVENERVTKTNSLNTNFEKKEFKEIWNRINRKAAYSVHFDSTELVKKCIKTLNENLNVVPLQYYVQFGEQVEDTNFDQIKSGDSFKLTEISPGSTTHTIHSVVKYDLIGKIAESVNLTRRTISNIISGLKKQVFAKFQINPESFISEATRLINEQKASCIIEHLKYDTVSRTHNLDIFTVGESKLDFSKTGEPLDRHIYDYVMTESKNERKFVQKLDKYTDVAVYAKLPKGFSIPTPVGNYNPDWAISFKEGSVKHVYFVAETKGSMSSMEFREIEKAKIKCARKFFDEINLKISHDKVKYDVVNSFDKLMEIVRG